jgi:phosphoribosylpyrophosphate synthetase
MAEIRRTKLNIVDFIRSKSQATADDIANFFNISRQIVHRHLADLVKKSVVYKIGKPPKVFYLVATNKKGGDTIHLEPELKKLIDENFLVITPVGEKKEGFSGFAYWCTKQNLPIEKTSLEYASTLKKYLRYKKGDLIDGMYKIRHTFSQVFLDKVFYIDFYSIERFGKTKLGSLLLYAKQSQNKTLIKELVDEIRPKVFSIIERFKIEAVGFIPPTVKRETQLMKELERELNLPIPTLNLVKVKTPVAVPQKTLSKLEDRIENAKSTIVVHDTKKYKTVFLIDDALGSGATLNETARKIKNQGVAETIIGLAITGSFSGFEIISEV